MVMLNEVCELITDGSHFSPKDIGEGFPMLSVKDMGERDFSFSSCKHISKMDYDILVKSGCKPQKGDVLVAKDGSYFKYAFQICEDREIVILSSIAILRPKADVLDAGYLREFLMADSTYSTVSLNYISGTALKRVILQGIKKIQIPLPPLEEQRRIAALLDKVSDLIAKRRAQLDKLALLIKARFIEMFGDPVLNQMKWPEQPLENAADIVSGITKGRKTKETELIEVPYMAVSNVKDGYIDWTTVKTILATKAEIKQYHLLPDDVLMTEGGDPDKLGRGAIIQKPLENCIHQNHIFRVRLNENILLPSYFAEFLQHQKAKQYFLRCAKQTTGIASINMRQLKGLPTLVPPLDMQSEFKGYIEKVERSRYSISCSLEKLETLKKTLMQQYFG